MKFFSFRMSLPRRMHESLVRKSRKEETRVGEFKMFLKEQRLAGTFFSIQSIY